MSPDAMPLSNVAAATMSIGEGSLNVRNCRSREARVGFGALKQDASVHEPGVPTVEALSRWENEGGAPDRRSELDNHTAPECITAVLAPLIYRETSV
jgi:hypothetical protein